MIQGSLKKQIPLFALWTAAIFIHGGKLYALGSNIEKPQSSSAQNSVYVSFRTEQAAGKIFSLQTEAGKSVALLKAKREASVFLVSDPLLVTGHKFNLYTGGQVTGTDRGGFYFDGNYSNGVLKAAITIGEGVTEEII